MDNYKKIAVLVKIAKEFNIKGITWALGGSMLLYLKKVWHEFDDIDIMINEKNVEEALKILSSMGTKLEPKDTLNYITEYFYEYLIDDVEIDLMANFGLKKRNILYNFPLTEEGIHEIIDLNGTKINLMSLETWYEYYRLMDRMDKVILLESIKRK